MSQQVNSTVSSSTSDASTPSPTRSGREVTEAKEKQAQAIAFELKMREQREQLEQRQRRLVEERAKLAEAKEAEEQQQLRAFISQNEQPVSVSVKVTKSVPRAKLAMDDDLPQAQQLRHLHGELSELRRVLDEVQAQREQLHRESVSFAVEVQTISAALGDLEKKSQGGQPQEDTLNKVAQMFKQKVTLEKSLATVRDREAELREQEVELRERTKEVEAAMHHQGEEVIKELRAHELSLQKSEEEELKRAEQERRALEEQQGLIASESDEYSNEFDLPSVSPVLASFAGPSQPGASPQPSPLRHRRLSITRVSPPQTKAPEDEDLRRRLEQQLEEQRMMAAAMAAEQEALKQEEQWMKQQMMRKLEQTKADMMQLQQAKAVAPLKRVRTSPVPATIVDKPKEKWGAVISNLQSSSVSPAAASSTSSSASSAQSPILDEMEEYFLEEQAALTEAKNKLAEKCLQERKDMEENLRRMEQRLAQLSHHREELLEQQAQESQREAERAARVVALKSEKEDGERMKAAAAGPSLAADANARVRQMQRANEVEPAEVIALLDREEAEAAKVRARRTEEWTRALEREQAMLKERAEELARLEELERQRYEVELAQERRAREMKEEAVSLEQHLRELQSRPQPLQLQVAAAAAALNQDDDPLLRNEQIHHQGPVSEDSDDEDEDAAERQAARERELARQRRYDADVEHVRRAAERVRLVEMEDRYEEEMALREREEDQAAKAQAKRALEARAQQQARECEEIEAAARAHAKRALEMEKRMRMSEDEAAALVAAQEREKALSLHMARDAERLEMEKARAMEKAKMEVASIKEAVDAVRSASSRLRDSLVEMKESREAAEDKAHELEKAQLLERRMLMNMAAARRAEEEKARALAEMEEREEWKRHQLQVEREQEQERREAAERERQAEKERFRLETIRAGYQGVRTTAPPIAWISGADDNSAAAAEAKQIETNVSSSSSSSSNRRLSRGKNLKEALKERLSASSSSMSSRFAPPNQSTLSLTRYPSEMFLPNTNPNELEDLECAICYHVAFDPPNLGCCQHLFCRGCVQDLVKYTSDKVCPTCRRSFKDSPLISHNLPALSNLRVKCPMQADGCQWQGRLGPKNAEYLSHVQKDCEFTYIWCPKCSMNLRRKELEHHLAETCSERRIKCKDCQFEIFASRLERHKAFQCQARIQAALEKGGESVSATSSSTSTRSSVVLPGASLRVSSLSSQPGAPHSGDEDEDSDGWNIVRPGGSAWVISPGVSPTAASSTTIPIAPPLSSSFNPFSWSSSTAVSSSQLPPSKNEYLNLIFHLPGILENVSVTFPRHQSLSHVWTTPRFNESQIRAVKYHIVTPENDWFEVHSSCTPAELGLENGQKIGLKVN